MNQQQALRSPNRRTPAENKELPPDQDRHSRKCQVCSHPSREEIEDEFIHWRKPRFIAKRYDISWASLYTHARVFDLFKQRGRQVRSVLENIMERGVETLTTGDTVLRAVKYCTCLTDDNKWIEPTSNVVFQTARGEPAPPPIAVIELKQTEARPPETIEIEPRPPAIETIAKPALPERPP